MRLAAPYSIHSRYNEMIDEYNLKVRDDETAYDNLIDFVQKEESKRLNLAFEKIDIKTIKIVNALNKNIYIRIMNGQLDAIKQLEENSVRYFFDVSIPIYSYTTLNWALSHSPTDIYITDDLCFNLRHIKNVCEKNGTQLRLVLNKIPMISSVGLDEDKPIFRPEDSKYLQHYFKTFEFDCFNDKNKYEWDKFEVLYKRWFIMKSWDEDLKYLNNDLSETYIKSTPIYKFNCKHRCLQSDNALCYQCHNSIEE